MLKILAKIKKQQQQLYSSDSVYVLAICSTEFDHINWMLKCNQQAELSKLLIKFKDNAGNQFD